MKRGGTENTFRAKLRFRVKQCKHKQCKIKKVVRFVIAYSMHNLLTHIEHRIDQLFIFVPL